MNIIKPHRYTARIGRKQYLNERQTFLFVQLHIQSAEPLRYYAGQYLTLLVGDERRSYSIANIPNNDNLLEIVVEIFPEGKGAQYIASAQVGESVEIIVPFGRFVLPEHSAADSLLFVATGSGIVPVKAMIENALAVHGPTLPITLLWGLRYEQDRFWIEEFEEWAKNHPNFRFLLSLSKPGEEWSGLVGRVTEHLAQLSLTPNSNVFICGSKQAIHDVREHLSTNGIDKKNIHTEQFY